MSLRWRLLLLLILGVAGASLEDAKERQNAARQKAEVSHYFSADVNHGPRNSSIRRRAEGMGGDDIEERRKKCPLTREQLESDHGDKWEEVRDILVGLRAPSPEAIMRARFTALRFKDAQFLAATEKVPGSSIRERNKQWSLTLGLEDMNPLESLLSMNNDAFNLREPKAFEVVSSDGEWVTFKVKCAGKTLSEKGRFVKDRTRRKLAAREHAKKMQEEKQQANLQRQTKHQEQEAAARTSKEVADVAKLCEEEKEKAMKSWRDVHSEINHKIDHERKKQEVLTSPQTAAVLRSLFRPPMLKSPGFIRAGVIPNDLKQQLSSYLARHIGRSFSEGFNPLLGTQRKTKMLPLPPSWIKQGGFMDNSIRPMLEKISGQKMELVHFHPGIRIYGPGSSLMQHLDGAKKPRSRNVLGGPKQPVAVTLLLSATEEGGSWHLELGDGKPRPVPLSPGQMLVYEGARLPHGRRGQLKSGEVALVFAYYRPTTYDSERVQRRIDQILAAQKVPPRGGKPPGPPKMPPKKAREIFGSADEL